MCPLLPVLFSVEALPEEPDADEALFTFMEPPELAEVFDAPSEDPPPLASGRSQVAPEEDPPSPEDDRGSLRNRLEARSANIEVILISGQKTSFVRPKYWTLKPSRYPFRTSGFQSRPNLGDRTDPRPAFPPVSPGRISEDSALRMVPREGRGEA